MKKASIVIALALGLLATLSTAATAGADPRFPRRSAGGRFDGGHSFHNHSHSFDSGRHSFHSHGHSFHKHRFGHHRFFPRHFVTFGIVAPPVVVYSPPPVFYAPPVYYSAPVYAPPAVYSPQAYRPPAPPRIVEYPTGRYELRGDGVTSSYTWVWIPNPPPPPPAAPPAPPAGPPTSSDGSPARHTQVFRWTDEQGVVHLTDRLDTVPLRYRQQAKPPGTS